MAQPDSEAGCFARRAAGGTASIMLAGRGPLDLLPAIAAYVLAPLGFKLGLHRFMNG